MAQRAEDRALRERNLSAASCRKLRAKDLCERLAPKGQPFFAFSTSQRKSVKLIVPLSRGPRLDWLARMSADLELWLWFVGSLPFARPALPGAADRTRR